MRWKAKLRHSGGCSPGDIRTRKKFAWLPKTIQGRTVVWLESYVVHEVCVCVMSDATGDVFIWKEMDNDFVNNIGKNYA